MEGFYVRQTRISNGEAGSHNGWFTFVRGAKVPRRAIFSILFGRYRSLIETVQSNDPKKWDFQ